MLLSVNIYLCKKILLKEQLKKNRIRMNKVSDRVIRLHNYLVEFLKIKFSTIISLTQSHNTYAEHHFSIQTKANKKEDFSSHPENRKKANNGKKIRKKRKAKNGNKNI